MKAEVNLVGNLTRDTTAIFGNNDGTAKRALFTVACNSRFKNAAGEKVETVDFIPCIAWNGLANMMKEWGLKGRKVQISGTLESFQKPVKEDGTYDPAKIQVRATGIEFLGMEDSVRTKLNGTQPVDPVDNTTPTAAPPAARPAVASNDVAEKLAALLGLTKPVSTTDTTALTDALTTLLNQPTVPVQTQGDDVSF